LQWARWVAEVVSFEDYIELTDKCFLEIYVMNEVFYQIVAEFLSLFPAHNFFYNKMVNIEKAFSLHITSAGFFLQFYYYVLHFLFKFYFLLSFAASLVRLSQFNVDLIKFILHNAIEFLHEIYM
jgi:hypothetical protein